MERPSVRMTGVKHYYRTIYYLCILLCLIVNLVVTALFGHFLLIKLTIHGIGIIYIRVYAETRVHK